MYTNAINLVSLCCWLSVSVHDCTVNRSRTKSNMTHNVTKLPQVKDNKSHVNALYVSNMPHHFLTQGVPNTPQVKPTEVNYEAYFTQHVSNATLCRCQIDSVFQSRSTFLYGI
jgi:hypothetical protein